jgi:hypothetical protein
MVVFRWMMKVYVFGTDLKGDHMAHKVAKRLKEEARHDFVFSNDPTDLMYVDSAIIMDVVKGIKKVTIFYNPADFLGDKPNSLHNFDLGYFLKLADSIRSEKKLTIVGVPLQGSVERITDDVRDSLQELQDSVFRI